MEVFVANLNKGIKEELLTKLFEPFGTVIKATIAYDKVTNSSKGYGFVIMENAPDAERAIIELNGREIAEKVIAVKKSIPTNERPKNTPRHEEIPVKVINKTDYKKEKAGGGYVKISFN